MSTSSLTITVQPRPAKKKIVIEMDAGRFERVAADLGLFNQEFIESLGNAEKEVAQKKLRKLRSLRDLRSL